MGKLIYLDRNKPLSTKEGLIPEAFPEVNLMQSYDQFKADGDFIDCFDWALDLQSVRSFYEYPDEIPYPEIGDLVIYFEQESEEKHYGIYLGGGRVASKWGKYGVFSHPLWLLPPQYGDLVKLHKLKEGVGRRLPPLTSNWV